jgi:O-antigen/teichoic acid export membrane protein
MNLFGFINKENLTIAFHKPFPTDTPEGRSMERRRRIVLTSITALIGKVLHVALPLITIKVTYTYLGVEVYGLWSAVTTFFALFAFSDLGLGNGLQTKLSQATGTDDVKLCRSIISNTYVVLWLVSFLLLIVFLSVYKFVDWSNVMNAKSNEAKFLAASVVFVIVLPKIFAIPVAIITRTQYALQEGFRSNTWGIIGSLISLLCVIIIAKFNLGKLTLVTVSSFLSLIVSALNMFVYFQFQRPELKFSFKLFDKTLAKELLSLGILFCVLSVFTTFGLSMDTFIVARTCSLEDAASYSIVYRLTAIGSGIVGVISAPLWGANGEAIARGDIGWVRHNTKRMSLLMGLFTIALCVVVLLFAKLIFRLWMGEDFNFSYTSLIWMSVMQVLLAFISPWFMVLNAYGIVKKQILLFAIYTPMAFALKYYLSLQWGVWATPFVGAVLYFFVVFIGTLFFSKQQLNLSYVGKRTIL